MRPAGAGLGAREATVWLTLAPDQSGAYLTDSGQMASVTVMDASVDPPEPVLAPVGIISWWPGQYNANDVVSGNNGNFDTPGYVGGEVGVGFYFDGTGNSVQVPESASLDFGAGSSGLTIETWVNPSSAAAGIGEPLVEWAFNDYSGRYGCHFWVNFPADGYLYANLVDTSGNDHMIQSDSGAVPFDTLTHVAVTYDKSSGMAYLYVNGAIVGSGNLGNFPLQTATDLYLGYRPPGVPYGPDTFTGVMDEPSLYNRALSQAEIQSIYNAGSAGKTLAPSPPPQPPPVPPPCAGTVPSGVVAWWPANAYTTYELIGGNNGSFTEPKYAIGEVGQAFRFDGSGNNVRVPQCSALNFGATSSGMTIEDLALFAFGQHRLGTPGRVGVFRWVRATAAIST